MVHNDVEVSPRPGVSGYVARPDRRAFWDTPPVLAGDEQIADSVLAATDQDHVVL